MTEPNAPKDQKKLRKAELIAPPNTLKQKVGSGGIDPSTLAKAQQVLDNNTIDFKPIAAGLLEALETSIQNIKNQTTTGEAAIEAMLYPAMQLKAQGAPFGFPLVTDISDILINFLETIPAPDKDALEIVDAHKKVISLVVNTNMKDPNNAQAQPLKTSLIDACSRYHKKSAS